ncbi:MAG: DUF928 domain-containing protein [Cyanobacteria bacterium J06600_6]
MRSILSIIIASLLLPWIAKAVYSVEAQQQQQSETKTSIEQKKPRSNRQSENLDFSGTGRPGQQTAGESRGSCLNANQPIEAILPISNSGKTVLGHPNFWVYLPETVNKTTKVEFVIQDESRKDVWRSRSAVNSVTGYESFSLPQTEAPLEIGQWYRWYVKVYCDEQVASTQYVKGWVNRVPLNSKLYLELQQNPKKTHLTYGVNSIWYDAIDELLNQYHRDPKSVALEKDWHSLIRAKGVELNRLPWIGGNQLSKQ